MHLHFVHCNAVVTLTVIFFPLVFCVHGCSILWGCYALHYHENFSWNSFAKRIVSKHMENSQYTRLQRVLLGTNFILEYCRNENFSVGVDLVSLIKSHSTTSIWLQLLVLTLRVRSVFWLSKGNYSSFGGKQRIVRCRALEKLMRQLNNTATAAMALSPSVQ